MRLYLTCISASVAVTMLLEHGPYPWWQRVGMLAVPFVLAVAYMNGERRRAEAQLNRHALNRSGEARP